MAQGDMAILEKAGETEVKEEVKEVKEEKEEVKEEVSEETEELVETKEETEEVKVETEEEITELAELGLRPTIKDINEKFPDFFKTYPEMRHMYFREAEMSSLFATVDEAKQANEDLEGFRVLENHLSSGKVEDTKSILSSVKEMGEDSLSNLAINFLPALQSEDQKSYYAAITPEYISCFRNVYDAGVGLGEEEGKNLRNAAMVFAQYYFKNAKVASGESKLELPKPKIADTTTSVTTEKEEFMTVRHEALYSDVDHEIDSRLSEIINNGLDPNGVMTPYLKGVLTKDIIGRINKVLAGDRGHQRVMSAIWSKAESAKFGSIWKDRIVTAALSRAKSIVAPIRTQARADALSTKIRHGNQVLKTGSNIQNKALNTGEVSNSGNSMQKIGKIDSSKIDYSKTSDLDIIQGKVILK